MKVEDSKIRCIYHASKGGKDVFGIKPNFDTFVLGENDIDDKNASLESLLVNNKFDFDIKDGSVATSEVIREFGKRSYDTPGRVFIYEDGEQLCIYNIFISRVRKAIRKGQQPKYNVSCLEENGNITPLFSFQSPDANEVDMHVINFEVERFLRMENINILDSEDIKLVFQLAAEYVKEIKGM